MWIGMVILLAQAGVEGDGSEPMQAAWQCVCRHRSRGGEAYCT